MNVSTLPYSIHGENPELPYILLVHGFMSSSAQWLPSIEPLNNKTANLIIVNLLGHNGAPSPKEDEEYFPSTYIRKFETIRKNIGVDRWFVCGQSLGAALTINYQLSYPDRVIGSIFTNTNSALSSMEDLEEIVGGIHDVARELEHGGITAIKKSRLCPTNTKWMPIEAKEAFVREVEHHDGFGLAKACRVTIPMSSVRDRVHLNTVPTMMVVGRRETRFRAAEDFARDCFSNLERVVLTQAGHAVNLGAVEEFNGAVVEFVGCCLGNEQS